MTGFNGVLAVLHTPTSDRRRLGDPSPELTRPLPIPLVCPGAPGFGRIDRVWRDGDLVRYSGELDDAHLYAAGICAGIEAGLVVGNLDLDGISADGIEATSTVLTVRGWCVKAATLMPSDLKLWSEVSLTLDNAPEQPSSLRPLLRGEQRPGRPHRGPHQQRHR